MVSGEATGHIQRAGGGEFQIIGAGLLKLQAPDEVCD